MKLSQLIQSFALLGLIALPTGCGSDKNVDVNGSEIPEWFLNQPPLCGVGVQKVRNNLGAAKRLAAASARTDLSRQLETKVKSMIKQYNQEGGNEDGDISEELSTDVSQLLSKQTINGSVPKKNLVQDNQFYTLVCLETDALTDAINNMKKLGNAQRKALARRAAAAHDELKEAMENYDR